MEQIKLIEPIVKVDIPISGYISSFSMRDWDDVIKTRKVLAYCVDPLTGQSVEKFTPAQVALGARIETREHPGVTGGDPKVGAQIAIDHLREHPGEYKRKRR